ncbi:enoyl-CoA hydratase/isomerase family protein [Tateyamaria armeniaca]|uniref:Enoyl-CoA hydratase/isomerase family protein n=1 Tax=Tateyamaria armeniaca TaxID=2518930 RepID=A0ABW8UU90_9RHOB
MIRVETADRTTTLTLDRPDKVNALTEAMLRDLVTAVHDARDAAALILTGTGKVFSAGADLDAARAGLATSPLWEELSAAIAAHPGLTLAALNGTVAGGANGMVLACDLRIGVPWAKFFYPVMKLGYLPQPSDPVRMAALIGPARTKWMLLAGQKMDTDQALNCGLIDEIVDGDALMERAHALCADCVAADPGTAQAIKGLCQ